MPSSERNRKRLMDAMTVSIEERGYAKTTVADVVRIARTSRRTYYEHFADRGACFLAAVRAVQDETLARVASAVGADRPWEEQVDAAIGAYFEAVAERPGLVLSIVRELPALGRRGAATQQAMLERMAGLLVTLVESGRVTHPELNARPLTDDMSLILVGGLFELTVVAIERGRDLVELRVVAADAVKAILSAAVLGG
ncbi:MAG: TetR/AcrR family transcriptional regulator [Solirubrobacteraceae bacterium]